MDRILDWVKENIKNKKMETYENIVYQIKCEDEQIKAGLKNMLQQGNMNVYHTVVEIDFVKKPVKLSRKKRSLLKKKQKECNEQVSEQSDLPNISIYNSPIYIYGEYIKLSRNMTQTPLHIGGEIKTERSVSDFKNSFELFYDADEVKFMSCGREDIDVRCIEGRPFILEVINPRRNLFKENIEVTLYKDIDIINLNKVKKECKELINSDESCKFYSLDIFSKTEINFESVYNLKQRTPLRVLHRRADLEREKKIEVLKFDVLKDPEGFYYEVTVKASSGAYIKEWVTGDFGRTVPNLNSDLLNLDVLRVEKTLDKSTVIHQFEVKKYFIE